MKYDYIVVGSGSSGGAMAFFLTNAGKKVLLIEAGNSFNKETFPDNEMDYNSQLFWNGAFEMNKQASHIFMRGKCLGGGSIVNQALMDRFDEYALKDWREESGIDFFTEEALNVHYDVIENSMALEEIERENWNRNAILFTEASDKLGLKWHKLRRAQNSCKSSQGKTVDCIVCLGGCKRDSKQSTMVTFIRKAKEKGLEIADNTEIMKLDHHDDHVTLSGVKDGKEIKFEASKVILAAGALGTTTILLRSGYKDKLPAVGEYFYTHTQNMNFARFKEPVNSHKGMFQGVSSDDMKTRELGFKMENVFAQPVSLAILFTHAMGKTHQEIMRNYNHLACIEIALRDKKPGRIMMNKKGVISYDKSLGKEDKQNLKRGQEMVREMFEAMNPEEIIMSDFTFALHLMGGARIGKDKSTSVVNENFQVHGHPNLYVTDSSIFPNSPGINPALTIMALSHMASVKILGGEN
ncbi:MAG: GMC family oxidoreductase [Candidatus Heimdallarchaeota archaeon]|nr:GMC family oxidoreductase [Candidatus Heimdallarchaeota archaeon]